LKQIFREVGPKSKSRRKVGRDIKKVEKHCSNPQSGSAGVVFHRNHPSRVWPRKIGII